jgi:hypothetical protein
MINRILLIDVDIFRNEHIPDEARYTHHPIGLLYLISAVKQAFPHIECKVLHTSVSADPLQSVASLLSSFETMKFSVAIL